MYDYLIVGAGLFGSVFACEANKRGKKCLVIDKRSHIAGNIYTEEIDGINVHKYGAHIFHTMDKEIWKYMQQFTEFNNYINSPIANFKGEIYNLPFNMNTFNKLWGTITPQEARDKINQQIKNENILSPSNLEEQALSLVGRDVYEKLVKEYTEKQWGRSATELPSFIIKRLPLRFIYDNNYFNDPYQGIPIGGYTKITERMLDGIDVELNTDFYEKYRDFKKVANKLVFTGMIDEYFDHKFGVLEYRSLRFENFSIQEENYQGNAVVNYTDAETPYTRIIEHKHFEFGKQKSTYITKEYPKNWSLGDEPYYPINNDRNNALYSKYKELAQHEEDVIFGGRLGHYKYYNMDNTVKVALVAVKQELGK